MLLTQMTVWVQPVSCPTVPKTGVGGHHRIFILLSCVHGLKNDDQAKCGSLSPPLLSLFYRHTMYHSYSRCFLLLVSLFAQARAHNTGPTGQVATPTSPITTVPQGKPTPVPD